MPDEPTLADSEFTLRQWIAELLSSQQADPALVRVLAREHTRTLYELERPAQDEGPPGQDANLHLDVPDDVEALLTTEAGLVELFGDPDAPPRRPRERVASTGALARWRRAIAEGVDGQRADRPSTWKLDALWRAAAYEAAAVEYDRTAGSTPVRNAENPSIAGLSQGRAGLRRHWRAYRSSGGTP